MAGPITWRSVMAESLAAAARPFEMARQSFGDAFGALNRVLDQRNSGAAEMAKNVQDTNQAAYADLVGTIARPEDAAALAPQLEARRALLTPTARNATRDLVDQRTSAVMKNLSERAAFEDREQERVLRPMLQGAQALAAKGDMKGFEDLMKANPGLERWRGDLTAKAVEGERGAIRFDREGKRFEWDTEAQGWRRAEEDHKAAVRPFQLETAKLEPLAKRTSIQANQQQIAESGQRMRFATEDRAREQNAAQIAGQRAYLKESGNEYAEGIFTANRLPELMKVMRENKVGDDDLERQAIAARLGKFMNIQVPVNRNGKTELVDMPMPMSRVLSAVLGATDQNINWRNEGWANEVEKALKNVPKDTYIDPSTKVARSRLADNYQEFLELQARALATPALGAGRAGGGGKK